MSQDGGSLIIFKGKNQKKSAILSTFYSTIAIQMKLFIFSVLFLLNSAYATQPPLPAENVAQIRTSIIDPNTLLLEWQIKPGYFLYQDRFHFKTIKNDIFEFTKPKMPKAMVKIDKQGKSYPVYRTKLTLFPHVIARNPGEATLKINYQGCADSGFCYAPQTQNLILTFDKNLSLIKIDKIDIEQPLSDTQPITVFSNHHWFITLAIFLGLGLLLAFTPCVLPMVPVLSSIIVGHGNNISTPKAFSLSLSYVLSMSFTYAVFGAVIALMGQNLQHLMQAPSVIITFSLLFIFLGLSMFGLYELKLPTKFQSKFAQISYKQASGHYLGAAIMGCLSTLILSPCVTAPLIGALSYIAQEGNIILGISALFMLGLGMGLPLILIGASLGKWLPHAGHWMNGIKKLFGIILIGVAITLLARLFPTIPSTLTLNTPVVVVKTRAEAIHALMDAQQANKAVLLDFYADWCVSCKIMEETTFKKSSVKKALENYIIIKADVTEHTHEVRALMKKYNIIAPPTLLFFDKNGNEIINKRHIGEIDSKDLIDSL